MARPKQTHPKSHIVSFRLTEEEFTDLAHKATAAGMPVNALARRLILSDVKRLVIEAEQSLNPTLIKQLYYIGHNLNQLVKNAHIFGRISPRIEHLCERIEALMDRAIGE